MNRSIPKTILLIFIILLFPASLFPQPPLSLTAEKALEIALQKNLEIKKQTLDYNAALRRFSNRYSVFLPSLVTSGGFQFNNQDPPWRATVSASLSLGLGMDQLTALKEGEITQKQAEMDYHLLRDRLSRDIKKLFYKLLLQREQELLLIQNIDSAKARYEAAQTDYSRGKISEYELLSARLSYMTIQPELEEFRISNRNEKSRFLRLLGLPGDTDFSLVGSLEVKGIPIKEEEIVSLIKEHASLTRQNLLIQQRTLAIRQLQNRYFPRVTLGVTPSLVLPAQAGKSPFSISGGSGGSFLSVTVSADLVDFIPLSAQRERIKTAEESLEKSFIDLDYLLQETEATVINLIARIRKAERDIEVYTLNLEVAEEFYRIALTEYNYGRQDLLALQDAEVRRQKARVDLLSRKASLIDLIIDLEYWIGNDLL